MGTCRVALASFVGFALLAAGGEAIGATTIGNTTIVVKTVTGTVTEGKRYLRFEDDIYHNELVETFEESATEITFLDKTTLGLGPNTRITLDRFVYDPDPKNSTFVLTITEGALRFTSGVLPKESYKVHTPVATIGIRGTVFDILVATKRKPDGTLQTSVSVAVLKGEADVFGCDRRISLKSGLSSTISVKQGRCTSLNFEGTLRKGSPRDDQSVDDVLQSRGTDHRGTLMKVNRSSE